MGRTFCTLIDAFCLAMKNQNGWVYVGNGENARTIGAVDGEGNVRTTSNGLNTGYRIDLQGYTIVGGCANVDPLYLLRETLQPPPGCKELIRVNVSVPEGGGRTQKFQYR